MGAVETKFFQFLLTEEERKDDGKKESKWKLPGEEEILRKMQSSESDMSAHLQKNFNPNKHMGPSPSNDTPLIYAVRFEHKLFLDECLRFGGDPFVTNAHGQTAFHVACASSRSSQRTDKKRKELLQMLLDQPVRKEYQLPFINGSDRERRNGMDKSYVYHPSVCLLDKDENTPLHLAAQSGLLGCVELLLAYGSQLSMKNTLGKTPCDLASDSGQFVIVKLLEPKMVFVPTEKSEMETDNDLSFRARTYTMQHPEGLHEMKEELVKELKAKLTVPPDVRAWLSLSVPKCGEVKLRSFAAELLLVHYDWSIEKVLEVWKKDPFETLKDAKLKLDESLFVVHEHLPKPLTTHYNGNFDDEPEFRSLEPPLQSLQPAGNFECTICYVNYVNSEGVHGLRCRNHKCCKYCFSEYVGYQVQDGKAQQITCPGQQCDVLIPSSTVERYMPPDIKEKYQRFGLAAFVEAHDKTKWCPRKGCEKVVTYPPPGGVVTVNTEVNVECEDGHTFCWECLEEPGHEPLPCQMWKQWQETIEKFYEGEVDLTRSMIAQAEAVKWIGKNTKPCPKCNANIQKTHGCNHMTCTKCRYDFCWVCLDPWKLHSRTTGGYFQCNRVNETMEANRKIDEIRSKASKRAEEMTEEIKEQQMKKFEILHKKYKSHLESMALECDLLTGSQRKLAEMSKMETVLDARVNKMAQASGLTVSLSRHHVQTQDKFLYNVYGVLIRSRPILAMSYALSYFLPHHEEATVLEHQKFQGQLEGTVEELARLVTEEHLKASKSELLKVARILIEYLNSYVNKFRQVAEECLNQMTQPPDEDLEETEDPGEGGGRLFAMLMDDSLALHRILLLRLLVDMENQELDDDDDDDDDDTSS